MYKIIDLKYEIEELMTKALENDEDFNPMLYVEDILNEYYNQGYDIYHVFDEKSYILKKLIINAELVDRY